MLHVLMHFFLLCSQSLFYCARLRFVMILSHLALPSTPPSSVY